MFNIFIHNLIKYKFRYLLNLQLKDTIPLNIIKYYLEQKKTNN